MIECPPNTLVQSLGLSGGGLAAVAGAGGKSTLARRLAREGAAAGLRTLVTATTRLGLTAAEGAGVLLEDDLTAGALARVAAALDRHGSAAVAGAREQAERFAGLPAGRVSELARLADLTVVESDGARGRLVKLPAAHEPVVPRGTSLLIVVVRLDVLGRPAAPAVVHRHELVAALLERRLGRHAGAPLDEDALAELLMAPQGYLARVPEGARAGVFLNAEGDEHAGAAERLAARLVPAYDLIAAGSALTGRARSWRRTTAG